MKHLKTAKLTQTIFIRTEKSSPLTKLILIQSTPKNQYIQWSVPSDCIVIFDEIHRCKDFSTDNGKLLESTKQLIQKGIPVLMLSATICEKFTDMKISFFSFWFYSVNPKFQPLYCLNQK